MWNKVYLRVAVVSNNINWWYFWTGTIRAEHPCAYKWREIFRLFLWYFSCRSKILSYIEIPGQANGIKIYTLFCPWSCYDPYTFKLVTIWPMGCLLFLKNCSVDFSFLYLFISGFSSCSVDLYQFVFILLFQSLVIKYEFRV